MRNSRRLATALFCAIAALTVTPLCGLWFSCGCDWPWEQFFMHCDAILKDGPQPHCPWCTHPVVSAVSIATAIGAGTLVSWEEPGLAGNALVTILQRCGRAAVVFVGVLFLTGWLTALATGHPLFLGINL